jgi:O-antigen/teichoic acid export membrane protein
MSHLRTYFKQSSQYLLGQGLIMLAGFASFPILTRILSVSEYGVLSLVTTTVSILLAFSKLGLNHSSVRYYQEYATGGRKESLSHFYNTYLLATGVCTIVVVALFWILFETILAGVFDKRFSDLIIFVGLLTLLRSVHLILRSFLRAGQRTIVWNAVGIAQRYLAVIFGLLFFLYFSRTLTDYYVGQTIAEVIVLAYLVYDLSRRVRIHWKYFSSDLFRAGVRYGIFMLGVEAVGLITGYTDRYLIEYFCGAHDLGVYSVAANMANYAGLVFTVPVQLGLLPVCMSLWVNKGRRETQEFLQETFRYFCLVAFPVTLAFVATSEDLIVLVASEKYVSSGAIMPYLLIANLLVAAANFFCAPILMHEKTEQLLLIYLVVCIENLALNILIIPRLGIFGAAYVSVIVWMTLFVLAWIRSSKYLPIRVPLRSATVYLVAALIMFLVVHSINVPGPLFLSLLLEIGFGMLVYAGLVVCLDRKVRGYAQTFIGGVIRNVSDRRRK